ncbi:MAG: N-glycosylase/DNA lyase [Candidatus Nanoarchaeia archaeon]|nr:N-glycosylase/DNA lyase [Candidatus Nanoarchaeia archaeon]
MELEKTVNELKQCEIRSVIDKRIHEFKQSRSDNEIFKELCFCLMTANFNAERSINIQNQIGNGFLDMNEENLSLTLKDLGHRFPNMRAKFIILARENKDNLAKIIKTKSENEIREWLVKNIKGLGYKEASHFMRNIGFENVAIIDFHIIDILVKNNLIKKPKTMTKKVYLETENVLKNLGEKLNLNMAELDLYLWYCETGKVLK